MGRHHRPRRTPDWARLLLLGTAVCVYLMMAAMIGGHFRALGALVAVEGVLLLMLPCLVIARWLLLHKKGDERG